MKIKEGIDLKELLKYGFHRYPCPIHEYYKVVYIDNSKLRYIMYNIETDNRKIKIETCNIQHNFDSKYYIDDTLYLLMKNNLIETVGDE